jgi:hypothetical protein
MAEVSEISGREFPVWRSHWCGSRGKFDFTRTALVFSAITMAVAAFLAHSGDPFGKKELALIYLVISIALIFTGPGKYALDKK